MQPDAPAMALVDGLNHVAVITHDCERFGVFYAEVFDADVMQFDDGLRHVLVRVSPRAALHAFQFPDNPDAAGSAQLLGRGHLDHVALNLVSFDALMEVRRRLMAHGASDGVISDLGPMLSVNFTDPDGMEGEVSFLRDLDLSGLHAPQPFVG